MDRRVWTVASPSDRPAFGYSGQPFRRHVRLARRVGLRGDFYRAMLCIPGTSHGPVSVSVCLSQVGVLLKRLHTGSQKQNQTIAQEV